MIELLDLDSLSQAFNIIDSVRTQMHHKGIDQWNHNYPNLNIIKADIQLESLFGYFHNRELAGIITLNDIQDDQYADIEWKYKNGKSGIIHRLAVDPNFQGQGIAKSLIKYAEQYFTENGFSQIRLDAYSSNPISLGLYEKLNYEPNGQLWFPSRKQAFQLFEKSLL